MKVTYDRQTDSLTVVFKSGTATAESNETSPGAILDYDDVGDLISLEILDAGRKVSDVRKIEFEIVG